MARRMESPPTPESKTPMGRSPGASVIPLGVPRGLDEFAEKLPRGFLVGQPLGVPLHREPEWMLWQFDDLHQPIGSAARDAKLRPDVLEALVVMAVHAHERLAEHLRCEGALLHLYFMDEHGAHV